MKNLHIKNIQSSAGSFRKTIENMINEDADFSFVKIEIIFMKGKNINEKIVSGYIKDRFRSIITGSNLFIDNNGYIILMSGRTKDETFKTIKGILKHNKKEKSGILNNDGGMALYCIHMAVCGFPEDDTNQEDLIRLADSTLNKIKNKKRNIIKMAEPEVLVIFKNLLYRPERLKKLIHEGAPLNSRDSVLTGMAVTNVMFKINNPIGIP